MTDQSKPMDPWPRVPVALQVTSLAVGLAACVAGMLDWVAEWSPLLATLQLLALIVAPIAAMLGRGRFRTAPPLASIGWDWSLSLGFGVLSLFLSSQLGRTMAGFPPAYHDEFSYLFQAQTLLTGHFTAPGHPVFPELFDQMHVLNEGVMASRYYPGTGFWLAPFTYLGQAYLGSWLAGALATGVSYWTARELAGRTAAVVTAGAMALSPGIGLFCNTLLAHPPTLLALSLFLLGVVRWRRTRRAGDAVLAGSGLAWAMLCRPMTAAAVGLPFGVDVALWLFGLQRSASAAQGHGAATPGQAVPDGPRTAWTRVVCLVGFGVPLVLGLGIAAAYNHAVTGRWGQSPYQLYTDIYTPRHVYGFNNVTRGERQLGPKVLDQYDRWAENLTPELALQNLVIRVSSSLIWTLDPLPLLLSGLVAGVLFGWLDPRWRLVSLAIVSLHALHLPYWYVGIMGWHYVFESSVLWCLVLGTTTALLFRDWNRRGWAWLKAWWIGVLVISGVGAWSVPIPDAPGAGSSRVAHGVGTLQYPRRRHADLRGWVENSVERPALVLLEQETTVGSHLDLVVNEPGLSSPLLLGRFRAGLSIEELRRAFPGRRIYRANPERRQLILLR